MKVSYFHYLYDASESSVGAATHIAQITGALKRIGIDIRIHGLNRFGSPAESVKSSARAFLKKIFSQILNQPHALISNGRYAIDEWRILRDEQPDVVMMRYNLLGFSLAVVSRMRKLPFILEINAPMAYENSTFGTNWTLPFLPGWIEKLNTRLADAIVVVSKELRDYYLDHGVPEEKIFVVPNGADTVRFHPNVSGDEVRSAFGLGNRVVVGFVGSFHYWHGMESLFLFVKETLDRYSNVVFLLVGTGPLKEALEKKVKETVDPLRVVFPGYVPYEDIPRYLGAMDVVLAPYPRLNFFYYSPIKVFEYMAAGKAVVASRIGQIRELIQDGFNGMLYDPDDMDGLREKCHSLIVDAKTRRKLGKRARETVVERFTWEQSAQQIVGALRQTVRNKRMCLSYH